MRNKGALTFLAVVLAIACAYQLSFTFVTRNVEKKAASYAAQFPPEEQELKAQAYLDSLGSSPVYSLGFIKYTYKESKEKEINLGLDLRGGMNVMLEISVDDVVRALANNSQDPVFNQAVEEAKRAQQNSSQDFIGLFADAYARLSNNSPLALLFNTPDLKDIIMPTSSNDEVVRILRTQANSAIANSYNVLRSRIDRFGVAQPNIQRLENSGRILVELPGVKEPERVRKLLQGTASLEFWTTYENSEILPLLVQANQITTQLSSAETANEEVERAAEETITEPETEEDEIAAIIGQATMETAAPSEIDRNTLFGRLQPSYDSQSGTAFSGPIVGTAYAYDTAQVNSYLKFPQIQALLPRDIRLIWGIKPVDAAGSIFQLYAIKANTRDGRAPLDGGAVVDAREEYSQTGSSAEVSMSMNAAGARVWARMTADNIGKCIAIVLDDYVYSAPVVHGEITGGRSSISGTFTIQEATDLANVLKSGKLPAPARIIQDTVVGPSLGREAINSGTTSFIIAFLFVLIYMIIFYSSAGVVACIALLSNLFFLFGVLASFGAVLTLPGIAGIVLTMGMAVDANVIIYERIKEEIQAGKGLSLAVDDGFKNAMSAIIDGNMTTLITGIVLFSFGTGPVQGFATTLIIGILTSLFSAIFITRLILTTLMQRGTKIRFSFRFSENFLKNIRFDFVKARKVSYIASVVLLALTLVSFAIRGLNYGVDFSGGRAYVVKFDQPVMADDVRQQMENVFGSSSATTSTTVQQFGSENQMRIVTQYRFDDDGDDVTAEIEGMLYNALRPLFQQDLSLEEFVTTMQNPNGIISSDKVGPSVAHDIKRNAVIAVLFSLAMIFLYIALRFRKAAWAAGGVIALFQNAIITIGVFSMFWGILPFNLEVDQAFIAAILTIVGYSINDTVVIFDRIREYRTLYPKRSLKENVNGAINSTLSRTFNTGVTTLVVLLAIFVFGGEVIRGFVFALMFGIVLGTFSSVFIATPIAYDFIQRRNRKVSEREA